MLPYGVKDSNIACRAVAIRYYQSEYSNSQVSSQPHPAIDSTKHTEI